MHPDQDILVIERGFSRDIQEIFLSGPFDKSHLRWRQKVYAACTRGTDRCLLLVTPHHNLDIFRRRALENADIFLAWFPRGSDGIIATREMIRFRMSRDSGKSMVAFIDEHFEHADHVQTVCEELGVLVRYGTRGMKDWLEDWLIYLDCGSIGDSLYSSGWPRVVDDAHEDDIEQYGPGLQVSEYREVHEQAGYHHQPHPEVDFQTDDNGALSAESEYDYCEDSESKY